MNNTKYLLFILLVGLMFVFSSCDESNRRNLGENYAREELKNVLADSSKTEINAVTIIPDKQTAVNISESILFKIYGEENIVKQRPYEIFFIDKYWILSGTLPKDMNGGTFLIIMNSKDGRVIKLTHGK